MSKIGKKIISIPSEVNILEKNKNTFSIHGPHGCISIKLSKLINLIIYKDNINIKPLLINKKSIILWGSSYSIIKNIVTGVRNKFSKELVINGLGYSSKLYKNFLILKLGYSHDIIYHVPENIKILCNSESSIVIEGSDKYLVGQVSSDIRKLRVSDPYQGKGIKYINEILFRKSGKKK